MTQTLPHVLLPAQFQYRLEPYWQSVAVYAVTLIVYVFVKALWETTLQTGFVGVVLTDPIVVLLALFVLVAIVSLIANLVAERSIIVTDDGIAFVSRFHERMFKVDEIEKISFGKSRRIKVRGMMSLLKVRIKGRKRALRIRPAVYENDKQLVAALLSLHLHKGLDQS